MKVKPIVIASLAKLVVGPDFFKTAVAYVTHYDDKSLTGEQKRVEVRDALCRYATTVAGWGVNLAIELAVAWLRSKNEG